MMRGSDVSRTGQIGLEGIKPQKVGELSRERSSRSESIGRHHLGLSNGCQLEQKPVAKLLQETTPGNVADGNGALKYHWSAVAETLTNDEVML